jgi:chromosome segregation ATPase
MPVKTGLRFALGALACSLAICCAGAAGRQEQSGASDPVADAARKAREQKKNAARPKKVFTDEDIVPRAAAQSAPAASLSTPGSSSPAAVKPEIALAQGAAKEAGKESAEDREDSNSEAAWRKRFAAQRKKISDAQQELDVLQREAQKADVQYYSDPQKALKEQYSRDEIKQKTEKIEGKKKEIAALQQQLSDMEDAMRRNGGDAGWAR